LTGVVYDTGALLKAERRDRLVWLRHDQILATGRVPVVPAVVLAQAWRGGPQALLSRFLRGCHIEPADAEVARKAGTACTRAGTCDVVDATVVVTAVARRALVVTTDPDDLQHLADAMGVSLQIRTV
jgi:predicted nucleic acid-binding protein